MLEGEIIDNPGLRHKDGDGGARFARAVRADHGDDGLVGRDLGGGRLPAFGGAARVLAVELDRVAEDLAARVVNRELGAVLGVETQRRVVARSHERVRDVDGIVGADVHAAQFIRALKLGRRSAAAG